MLRGEGSSYRPWRDPSFTQYSFRDRLKIRLMPRVAYRDGMINCCQARAHLAKRFKVGVIIATSVAIGNGGGGMKPHPKPMVPPMVRPPVIPPVIPTPPPVVPPRIFIG